MSADPTQKLLAATQAISTAVLILKMEVPTFSAFLKEARDMDNFGHIVDPTLWKKSERRAVTAVVEPLFKAALAFVAEYEAHVTRSREALDKVNSR